MGYAGRFAPTPTGLLHQGSLVAALGSYLRARLHQGIWRVRIEDLDPPREEPGAAAGILSTLEAHGLYWDGEVQYQSHRDFQQRYHEACAKLLENGMAYRCCCSRKRIKEAGKHGPFGPIYPGWCRHKPQQTSGALRLITHDKAICLSDLRTGDHCQKLASELGDFVIQRADGYYAYQLAVVIDDACSRITEVVRGEDLLDNTPRQIFLQQCLGYLTPQYLHLPLVYNESGQKLSKQNLAPPLDKQRSVANLLKAARTLGLNPHEAANFETPGEVLDWAVQQLERGQGPSWLRKRVAYETTE